MADKDPTQEEWDSFEVTELDDRDLEDVVGGAGNCNCGCPEASENCNCSCGSSGEEPVKIGPGGDANCGCTGI